MKQALHMCPLFCLNADTKKSDMHEYALDLSATDQEEAFRELTWANRIDVGESTFNLLFISVSLCSFTSQFFLKKHLCKVIPPLE